MLNTRGHFSHASISFSSTSAFPPDGTVGEEEGADLADLPLLFGGSVRFRRPLVVIPAGVAPRAVRRLFLRGWLGAAALLDPRRVLFDRVL